MDFSKLKKIGMSNVPLVFVPVRRGLEKVIQGLTHHNIDVFCAEDHQDVNSICGMNKIQMICDVTLISTEKTESITVKFANSVGQPIFYIEIYDDLNCLYSDIFNLVKYPNQFMMMRLLHSSMYFLHVDKNKDYSPSNILGTGQAGIATRLWDKCARYMNLIGFDITTGEYTVEKKPKNESILDTLIDAANYALIGIIHRFGRWGQ